MKRIGVSDVRKAHGIRLPGERSWWNAPCRVPQGWLELLFHKPGCDTYLICPATRQALKLAQKIRMEAENV